MNGAGPSAACRILEYLIIQLQDGEKGKAERFSTLQGMLVVFMDIEDSLQQMDQSYCVIVISAKGDFCHRLLSDQIQREIEGLLPLCQRKAVSGKGCPHEPLHAMPFQLSFKVCEKSRVLEEDCLAMKQFIHRISLVHTMINFHYCVKVNGRISAETYSAGSTATTCLPQGMRLLTDANHFVRSTSRDVNMSCNKIHPVVGEQVGLFLPDEVAKRDFSGELRLTPVVALCPCLKPFPNQLTRITALSVFLYDPAGLPVLLPAMGASCSFFEDPSSFAAWEKYGYMATLNSDPYWEEDTAKPDVKYRLHASQKQDQETSQQQTLLLFLFLNYSDQFQDKPVYNFWDRQAILSHFCPILLCSKQAVKGAIQGVLNGILEKHQNMVRNLQKLTYALPVMAESISSIVLSSTDGEFRKKCFQGLQVADTKEFQATIKETFKKVILKQWKPSGTCDIRRLQNDKTGGVSADLVLYSDQQKPFAEQETEKGKGSHENEELDRSEPDGTSRMKKRKPISTDFPIADSEGQNVSLEAEEDSFPAQPDVAISHSSYPSFAKIKDQAKHAASSVNGVGNNENLWQVHQEDEDFWDQEVSNLAEWSF
ncbi:type 2 DNA topoisomerase 6 subunit B-like [Anolis carolinensis]|uniref:type 2 DNA topoisomerase 6 subunit B-like n=1 Tax=Anolis carolinensis TaxID=28377 RepID=UPI002F2B8EAE